MWWNFRTLHCHSVFNLIHADLTFEKAMRIARQQEAVKEQQAILREAADSEELDYTVIRHAQVEVTNTSKPQ